MFSLTVILERGDIQSWRVSLMRMHQESSSMRATPDFREQKTPRISANELARFLVATDLGREGIIRNARWQGKVRVARYRVAKGAMCEFLTDNMHSHRIIGNAKNKLEGVLSDPEASAFKHEDARSSIVALDAFQRGWNAFGLGGLNFDGVPKLKTLEFEGVEISVQMDAVTKRESPSRPTLVGGVLLRMARGDGETDGAAAKRREIGRNAAVLVYLGAEQNLGKLGTASPELCYSVDVQHGESHQAPKNYLAIVENMNAACRTIAALWDSAVPPGGK
ncbi:MAG TPA: hypothetical protein VLC74_10710 [Rhizomicrobium sp.]|nr:hypothetical protein [Rhizomicrobium sp.]